jgi:hypothetical protein
MPAKTRTFKTPADSLELQAMAYNDAVRDILHSDGKFHLGDERRPDAVWEWDGVRWSRIPLLERDHGRDEPPFVEIERDEEIAVAG